jgi:hypothetical protein
VRIIGRPTPRSRLAPLDVSAAPASSTLWRWAETRFVD